MPGKVLAERLDNRKYSVITWSSRTFAQLSRHECKSRSHGFTEYLRIIDLDVRAFFDSVDHSLMLKAVERHTGAKWVLLYVARWLKAPMQKQDGTLAARDREPRRVQGYPRFWRTCISITRSICGWPGNIRVSRSSGIAMMR